MNRDSQMFALIAVGGVILIVVMAVVLWSQDWGLRGDIQGTWEDVAVPGYILEFEDNSVTVTNPNMATSLGNTFSTTYKWEEKDRIRIARMIGINPESYEVRIEDGLLILTTDEGDVRRLERVE